jgi:DNA repair exonuclease SbcCD ATPase subunit
MEKGLKELLESTVLNEETKAAFMEAMNKKLDEVRTQVQEQTEQKIRTELSERYNQDKQVMLEAMDNMLTDAVKRHAQETLTATKALNEERNRLTNTIKETRQANKQKIVEQSQMLESFVFEQLKDRISQLTEDQNAVEAQRIQLARQIKEAKATVTQQAANRINQLESFVMEQLSKEVKEFKQDKENLDEMRVRLATESKAKLEETRKAFIQRASQLIESTVQTQLRKEMNQLKEDIRAARENTFARRIFEAFQAEYMQSYLNEGSQVKELNIELNSIKDQLSEAQEQLSTKNQLVEMAERKVQKSEDRIVRIGKLHQILRPLSKDKREIMESLLSTVKTEKLEESFRKYLPTVMNEYGKDKTPVKSMINENNQTTRAVTGDRKPSNIEVNRAEDQQVEEAEILHLRRLAGIGK